MGYAHYYQMARSFSDCEWKQICKAVRHALNCLPEKTESDELLILGDGLGEKGTRPKILDDVGNASHIEFNGIGDLGHETFWLSKSIEGDGLGACKTAGKPYDLAVCVALLIAADIAPDAISFTSDGDWDTDWKDARWYAEFFKNGGNVII